MSIKEVVFLEGQPLSSQSEQFKNLSKTFVCLEKCWLSKKLCFWTYKLTNKVQ